MLANTCNGHSFSLVLDQIAIHACRYISKDKDVYKVKLVPFPSCPKWALTTLG